MMYKEKRLQDIPCLSFLKGSRFNLYVGPKLSWLERRKLRMVAGRYTILYLPDICDRFTSEKLSYNFPGVEFPKGFSLETIYDRIREEIGGNINPECKFFIRYDGESFVVFSGGTTSLDLAISYLVNNGLKFIYEEERDECLYRMGDAIDDSEEDDLEIIPTTSIIEESCEQLVIDGNLEEDEDDDIRFSCKPSMDDDEVRFRVSDPKLEPNIRYRASQEYSIADASFDTEMTKAAEDVKKAIDALLMTGFPIDIIQSWLTEKVKLSRLRITKQYKILLVDYDKEIKMGPLPKTVFLFYLRHPEGVRFSYLQDHVKELRYIYEHVSVNDNLQKMKESIDSLTDPLSNSICEKCAAIKKAFVLQVSDNIAKYYYVTGMQGGKKGIALDRNLVEWECQL